MTPSTYHREYTNTRQGHPYSTTEIIRRMPRGLRNRLIHDHTDLNTWPPATLDLLAKLDAIQPSTSTKKSIQWAWTQNGRNARRDIIKQWERIA